jgi:indole-3-glycerol phosphate synthase
MRATRRFSQAISEGDGISLLATVGDAGAARDAEAAGAEGVVIAGDLAGLRDATELPVLWSSHGLPEAAAAGADACLVRVQGLEDDDGRLEDLVATAVEHGLEAVVCVADEDELRLALDRLDPEVFLLSARDRRDHEALEHVLGLLPDVPAGKLAIAELPVRAPEEIAELERAGVDAVLVRPEDVASLVGHLAPPA